MTLALHSQGSLWLQKSALCAMNAIPLFFGGPVTMETVINLMTPRRGKGRNLSRDKVYKTEESCTAAAGEMNLRSVAWWWCLSALILRPTWCYNHWVVTEDGKIEHQVSFCPSGGVSALVSAV